MHLEQKQLADIYSDLASIYYDREAFKLSLSYYQRSEEIRNKNNLENSSCYNGMGSCNFLLGDTLKAEEFYKLAIQTRILYHGPETPLLAGEFLSYSIFLKRIGRTTEGLSYVKKALQLYRQNNGEKFKRTSQSYAWLGTFYLEGKQPEKALDCFQRALVSAVENFGNYNTETNPELTGSYFGPELIEALKYKAQALDSIYRKNPSNLSVLRNEFETYDLVLRAIHKQRTSFPELNSKLSISGTELTTYLGAVESAFQLYKRTGDVKYKLKAFEFAEKSRSAILLTSLKEKQAISYGGLPDSLVEKEKNYSQMIENYQGMLVEERQKQGNNSEIIKEIENKIFQLRSGQNDLVAQFEKQFPQYYQLKYSDKILDVITLQKRLTDRNAILEYAVTDRNILIFVITKDKFEIVPVTRTASFNESLTNLNKYLRETSFISQEREVYEDFLNAGYDLYKKLIKPVEPLIRNKELIIVPDETLSSIPFEVLLTGQADPMQEFSTLPYLIEKYPIGYAYSANLLFFNYKKFIPEKVRLAAFSPTYILPAKPSLQEPYLRPLKFAKEEASAASEFFRGRVFDGEDATESNFRAVVEKYDILHLAMHAIMDNENPMYSKLAFTRETEGGNDSYLNTYELFNMKLKARMVVLSACNTGAGTLQKGEGIMSLARGFYYAGCPDVVMTLWPVEDKMSTQLIKDFYTYLSLGMNKIEALRLAKLNLIRSSDPLRSHPFFWAGYVNIGDISPVIANTKKKPTGKLWVLTAGISLLLIVPMVWKKFRR
ncbi:MAG: CHAT domain-containing protein [Bacteroidales bacterium]